MEDWRLSFAAKSVAVDLPFPLGRAIAEGEDKPHVGRLQATLLKPEDEDDCLLLRAEGAKNPTGVRHCGNAGWLWLWPGQTCILRDGDEIALNRTLRTVCRLHRPSKRRRTEQQQQQQQQQHNFVVGNFYLNLLPGELPSARHVSYSDLLPDNCKSALFTSLFPEGSYQWLRSMSPHLRKALVVADRCPAPPDKPKPSLDARDDEWLLLQGQRNGLVHASLLLFRTPSYLRVVCGGTNLEGQFDKDRDALFVQDFPVKDDPRTPAAYHDAFGAPLLDFLEYLPTMYEGLGRADKDSVTERCEELICGVDFSSANGALVTCLPSNRHGDTGGWKMLEQALHSIGAPRTAGGRIDIATGHYGALHWPFLSTMTRTLRRQRHPSAGGHEEDVGRTFLYHSSRATVLAPGTNSFAVMRTTAPGHRDGAATEAVVLDKLFHDAKPKFEGRSDAPSDALTPILHGKTMLATAADGASGTMFVGSQNFSAASWGLRDRQPANVELGVVLASHTPAGVEELRARFPIALAPDAAFGTTATERGYVMARGPTDGDHSPTGVQFRWRNRCNDPQSLGAWRLFLHRWWKMCSRCRAPDVPCDLSVAAIEELANAGEAFLCSACA